ncbi:hypothetical protein NW762_000651 [Fusarium torreyae]|uniref:DUF202 domain-containing protein n=1 Tax=Fusarium torreyae TaxID=1237075 RepID=A0A9W8VNL4_9HYPO|nr:hypothetical protein NW762_000651 [Fusarium torreyae]
MTTSSGITLRLSYNNYLRNLISTTNQNHRLVEIRAAQRTFEGAYVRTALGQFSFALIILKVFTSEFYAIGALFAVYGVAVMLVAIYRRYEGQNQFFTSESVDGSLKRKFRTSGNKVLVLPAAVTDNHSYLP